MFKNNNASIVPISIGTISIGIIALTYSNLVPKLMHFTSKLFFRTIHLNINDNNYLFPKLQTYIKQSYGGTDTLIDNGNDIIRTGLTVNFNPLSIIKTKYKNSNFDTWIYLGKSITTDKFIDHLNTFSNLENSISVYTLASTLNGWNKAKSIKRYTPPLYYAKSTIDQIIHPVSKFLSSKNEYNSLGKNYKLTLLFYGPTGTGKTTFAKGLAMSYGRDIYVIDPTQYFANMLDLQKTIINSSILNPCRESILLFEDVDRFFVSLYSKQERPNISSFLNFLDGLCTPENIIIIMTANYKGNIPDEIRRDGRIDHMINFSYVNDEIIDIVSKKYGFDSKLITIKGFVTISETINKIDSNLLYLQEGNSLIIGNELLSTNESMSVISDPLFDLQ